MNIRRGELAVGGSIKFEYIPIINLIKEGYEFSESLTEIKLEDMSNTVVVERFGDRKYIVKIPTRLNRAGYSYISLNNTKIIDTVIKMNLSWNVYFGNNEEIVNSGVYNHIMAILRGGCGEFSSLKQVNYFLSLLERIKPTLEKVREEHKDIVGVKTYNGFLAKENLDKEIERCSHCGKYVLATNENADCDINGNIYCKECYDKLFYKCDKCNEIVRVGKKCSCGNPNRIYTTNLFLSFNESNEKKLQIFGLYERTNKKEKSIVINKDIFNIKEYNSKDTDVLAIGLIADTVTSNKVALINDLIISNQDKLDGMSSIKYCITNREFVKHALKHTFHTLYEKMSFPLNISSKIIENFGGSQDNSFILIKNINYGKFLELLQLSYDEIYNKFDIRNLL